ncbi:MAG: uncharacterized protein KVP18_000698 [Porospora cf. gigantea A]|uniref:uncharacterized protein n=1 Tax=Porospora cf. gigantea A TaxID=2853593 RepID=UPI00355953BE|nr:MAG: hypothetical protein KVP18_000698 [Porospora cf. gigantea A]
MEARQKIQYGLLAISLISILIIALFLRITRRKPTKPREGPCRVVEVSPFMMGSTAVESNILAASASGSFEAVWVPSPNAYVIGVAPQTHRLLSNDSES